VDPKHVTLAALFPVCGEELNPNLVEQLRTMDGMPCEDCMKIAITSGRIWVPPEVEGQ
jgi:hypothetical protein